MGDIRVGTSGWVYKHWRDIFYEPGLPQSRWFARYAEDFDTVEINGSFYRLPSEAAFSRWAVAAPEGFVFAVKAPMWAANMTWFVTSGQSAEAFLGPMRQLGPHLGPVLYQFSRQRRCDLKLLADFTARLPKDVAHVFEFRHASWFTPSVKSFLAEHDIAFCIHDHRTTDFTSPDWVTAKTVYWRFHGNPRSGEGSYGDAALREAAERIRRLARRHAVYVYFNNDWWGSAFKNALRLKALLGLDARPRRRRGTTAPPPDVRAAHSP
jgi:uncharacterized protein YecE (DUF72 family)